MDNGCLSNESLRSLTKETMKVLDTLMSTFPVEEGEDFTMSISDMEHIVQDRLRSIILELGIYLHPRKTFKEIERIREKEFLDPPPAPKITPIPDIPTVTIKLREPIIPPSTLPSPSRSTIIPSMRCIC
jgi:hypothetical protein